MIGEGSRPAGPRPLENRQIEAGCRPRPRMDAETPPGSGCSAGTDRTVTVVGVDPADPRAVAELPRLVSADATGLYRVPALDRRAVSGPTLRRNPPGVAISFLQRLRGNRPSVATLEDATSAAASECTLPVRTVEVDGADREPGDDHPPHHGAEKHHPRDAVGPRRGWWTVGAWAVTALTVGVPIAAVALLLVAGGLLVWLLSALLVIGVGALLVGFALLSEAAAIRHTDASFAAAIASAEFEADAVQPVVVVPARNAPGVAAALRERGIAADARGPGVVPRTDA